MRNHPDGKTWQHKLWVVADVVFFSLCAELYTPHTAEDDFCRMYMHVDQSVL